MSIFDKLKYCGILHYILSGSKSESNADNDLESASQGSEVSTSPPGSAVTRRRTFWSNFKSRTRKLRSRSADSSSGVRGDESKETPKTRGAAVTAGVQDAPSIDVSSLFHCRPDHTPPIASRDRQFVADLDDLDIVYEFPVTLNIAETGRDEPSATHALCQPTDTTMVM